MVAKKRITIPEGGSALSLEPLEDSFSLPVGQIKARLIETSGRLRRELRLRDEPFTISDDTVSANGLAGIVRLAPGVEIEVVPKCLLAVDANWHDDFLLMATVTKLGRTFPKERVSAGLSLEHRDVLTLLAAVFLESLQTLNHVPIREYRKVSRIEPHLDAELDYSEAWAVRPEGYPQTGPMLSTDNPYLAVIGTAAAYLADTTADTGIGHRLRRIVASYPTVVHDRIRSRVPGRFARWQDLYDLAIAVREGLGMRLGAEGVVPSPGFVLNTERGWEDLLTLALTAQGGELQARAKPASKLGTRAAGKRDVFTYPDLVLNPLSYSGPIVVDAKYKGTATKPIESIGNDDLYEVLAFLSAQNSNLAVLLYPGSQSTSDHAGPGDALMFDEVTVGTSRVIGVRVSTVGIGRRNGFSEFGHRLGQELLRLASV